MIRILSTLVLWLAAAAAAAPITVSGSLFTAEGAPLAGARVEVRPLLTGYATGLALLEGVEPEAAAVAATGPDGRFRLEVPAAGLWRLEAHAAGFVAVQLQPLAVVEAMEVPPAALARDAGAEFTVVDATGSPMTGIEVAAVRAAGGPWEAMTASGWTVAPRRGRSGAGGRLTLPRARSEELALTPRVPGRVGHPVPVAAGGTLEMGIAGPRAAAWTLEVRDPRGRPESGVLVLAGELATPLGLTGADGRLRLSGGRGEVELLLLAADGRRQTVRLTVPAPSSRAPRLLPVELDGGVHLSGRVIAADGREPLAGALVWSGVDPGRAILTGAEGEYRFLAAAGEATWLQAEHAGFLPLATVLSPAERERGRVATLALERPVAVTVTVTDPAGSPLAGVRIEAVAPRGRPFFRPGLAERHAVSGPRGELVLARLRPEVGYSLHLSRRGFLSRAVQVNTRSARQRPLPLRLEMLPDRGAHGRVVDLEERPVAAAEIVLLDATRDRHRSLAGLSGEAADPFRATTDEAGRFEIASVPGTVVDLAARKTGYAPASIRGLELPDGRGAVDLGTLVLVPGATLHGRVVDREGEGVGDAAVVAVAALPPHADRFRRRFLDRPPDAVSDTEGLFTLEALSPGAPLDLLVHRPGFHPVWLRGVTPPVAEAVRVVLEPAARVAGIVLDASGQPIAAAEVDLEWQEELSGSPSGRKVGPRHRRTAHTGTDGRFEIADVGPCNATVRVRASAFVPAEPVDLRIPGEGTVDGLRWVLERGAAVEGRAAIDGGEPVAGVRVTVGEHAATTDADGEYRIEGLVEGPAELVATHPHYPRQVAEIEVEAGDQRFDLAFAAGREVHGRVTDRARRPVARAGVRLVSEDPGAPRELRAASAEDGTFMIAPVVDGSYRVEAGRPGFAPARLGQPVVVAGEPVKDLEIVLEPGIAVRGRILGLEFDELARVRLVASGAAGPPVSARVDYQGRFRVEDLAPGPWLLEASLAVGRRHAQARVLLETGDLEVEQDVEFVSGVRLTGQVLYDGEPLAGARLGLSGSALAVRRSVATDYSGRFVFEDLEPGEYLLAATHPRQLLVHNERIELDGERDLLLALGTAVVSGRVVDRDSGRPVGGALILLDAVADAPGRLQFLVTGGSEADGTFELPRVPPGRYRMAVRKDGYGVVEQALETHAGLLLNDLEIALPPTAGLELAVRLESGTVPPQITVRATDGVGRAVVQEHRALDPAGRARLATLPAGSWRLLVAAPGAVARELAVTAPGEPVQVVLADAGRLRVRVPDLATSDLLASLALIDAGHRAFHGLDARGDLVDRWRLAAGEAVVDGLQPGAWTLRVTAVDGRIWQGTAILSAAAVTEVELP